MSEDAQGSAHENGVTVPALAMPEGWTWVIDLKSFKQPSMPRLPEGLTWVAQAELTSPEGHVAASTEVPAALAEAYADGFIAATELVDAGDVDEDAPVRSMLSAEFRTISELRLPVPDDPAMLERYVGFCCEAAALRVVKESCGAMSRAEQASREGRFLSEADRSSIQQAMAACAAAREYAVTCKMAVCAALTRDDGRRDLIDTIACAAMRQAEYCIAASEPGNDGLGVKFLEAEFDGVEVESAEYLDYRPAKTWKTDREIAWAEDPTREEDYWVRVAEAQGSGADEPTFQDEARLMSAGRAQGLGDGEDR